MHWITCMFSECLSGRARDLGPSPGSPLLSQGLLLASPYSEITFFSPLTPCIQMTFFHKEFRLGCPKDSGSKAAVQGILLGTRAGKEPTCG